MKKVDPCLMLMTVIAVMCCSPLMGDAAQPVGKPDNPVAKASGALAVVLGTDGGNGGANRVKAARELSLTLTLEEVRVLYGLLQRKEKDDPAMPGLFAAIKNEVANALISQERLPSDLVPTFVAMYRDTAQDEVWRDYCIQHLGAVYERLGDSGDRKLACDTIWAATGEEKGSIPGSALIAILNRNGQPGFEKQRLSEIAIKMIRGVEYGEPAKISAFQVCSKLGEKAVLKDARQAAESGESVLLRASAIAYLGKNGDASDAKRLRQYVSGAEVRLRVPAQSALKQLKLAGIREEKTR